MSQTGSHISFYPAQYFHLNASSSSTTLIRAAISLEEERSYTCLWAWKLTHRYQEEGSHHTGCRESFSQVTSSSKFGLFCSLTNVAVGHGCLMMMIDLFLVGGRRRSLLWTASRWPSPKQIDIISSLSTPERYVYGHTHLKRRINFLSSVLMTVYINYKSPCYTYMYFTKFSVGSIGHSVYAL